MSQVWLITGASRGLGRAIMLAALEAGHCVVATSRSVKPVSDIAARYGNRLLEIALDVTTREPEIYSNVVQAAVDHFGRIDVLVNNAGFGELNHFEETSESQILSVFETNVFGLMRMSRAVLPVMRHQRSGHILNVSSVAGYTPGSAIYSATKFAVTGFTASLSLEVAAFGIKVTNVAPGYFRTDFLDASSVVNTPNITIDDYTEQRQWRQSFIEKANHSQAGNPKALGNLLVEVAATDKVPVHLPVGADAIQEIEAYYSNLNRDISLWQKKSGAATGINAKAGN